MIVIPGILGSRLVHEDSGTTVWGAFGGGFADPRTDDGARLVALPMQQGVPLSQLRDDVVPDQVLDRLQVNLLGMPLELGAYVNILRSLGVGGYRDRELARGGEVQYASDHFTCFQFAYDWRRDNAENAARLHQFILETRDYVRKEYERRYGPPKRPIKFDLVAHSMGGLMSRYYLRYGDAPLPEDGSLPELSWAGAQHVQRLVMIGTPNAGSIQSLFDLSEGVAFAPVLPSYPAAILGTMPGIYQLLPRARHGVLVDADDPQQRAGDPLDPELWRRHQWGLADPSQDASLARLLPDVEDPAERRAIALDHLEKALRKADQFQRALDVPARPPEGTTLHLFAGDAKPTSATASVDAASGEAEVASDDYGDGIVLRTSALMDERVGQEWSPGLVSPIHWRTTTFLFTDHLGLTRDPVFTDNLLFMLLEQPRVAQTP